MSLRYIDSFDGYATADLSEKWDSVGSFIDILSGGGRRGTNCLRFQIENNNVVKILDAQSTWILGVAVYFQSFVSSGRQDFLVWHSGTTECLNLGVTSTGAITIARRDGPGMDALLGTSTFTLSLNTWYYLEWKITIDNTNGVAICRVDGDPKLTLTGVDTQRESYTTVDRIYIGEYWSAGTSITVRWDDLYICDGQGSGPDNDFLGDCRVDAVLPDSNGGLNEFTPSAGQNYACVDENPANDDTDYVSSTTVGHEDRYGFTALPSLVNPVIYGVQLSLNVKDPGQTLQIAGVAKSGATTGVGSTQSLPANYAYRHQLWTQNPDTSAAWTQSGVNGAEFGLRIIS